MKAMIFAAGLGTRLRPLTNTRPKALIDINGVPLLEIVIKRLTQAGVDEIIINVHHCADQIAAFLQAQHNFGIRVELSYEESLLDTGGGLKKAARFFDDGRPFLVHNVDVVSDIDLREMYNNHLTRGGLATLAVKQRSTSRYLIFDEDDRLCGWKSLQENRTEMACPPRGKTIDLAFGGIHVISPSLLEKITEEGVFSIMKPYLRLAAMGENIFAYRTDDCFWLDAGKLENLQQHRRKAG